MLEWRHPLLVWLKILDLTADEQEKKKKKSYAQKREEVYLTSVSKCCWF